MNKKLYLVTVETDFMEYKSGRILAKSKRSAVVHYCISIGLNVEHYRHYGDTHKVDIVNTGREMYCYCVELK